MALCSQVFNRNGKRTCSFKEGSVFKRSCILRDDTKCHFLSSSEEIDSEDEQSCYDADQIRAKRRASTRVSFSLDSEISRAVSQYSDDEDRIGPAEKNPCKYVSNAVNNGGCIERDKAARAKCFEYLIGAIDEAWARYCDITALVEDQVYGYTSPKSVVTDDEDYLGNSTDITDYESEIEGGKSGQLTSGPRKNESRLDKVNFSSNANGSSGSLQALKDRLTKAKYFLQDLVDSDIHADICAYWKRWDMIKYATIELVEEDDDDDVIEATVEELEEGRSFLN